MVDTQPFSNVVAADHFNAMMEDRNARPDTARQGLEATRWAFEPGVYRACDTRCHTIWIHPRALCFDLIEPINGASKATHVFDRGAMSIQIAGERGAGATGRPCDIITLSLPKDQFALFAEGADTKATDLLRPFGEMDETALQIALVLASPGTRGPRSPLLQEATETAFLTRLLERHVARFRPWTGKLAQRVIARIDDYVRAHLDSKITIDDMACVAGLSPYHFSRAFAQTTGETPHRYVMRSRIDQAFKMLLATSASISDVAYRSGFADQSHLNRWMKRVQGATPAQIRLQNGIGLVERTHCSRPVTRQFGRAPTRRPFANDQH